jgi:dolichol-phosphate mannosyltransferase
MTSNLPENARLSFVVPAHDEEDCLPTVLDQILRVLDALSPDGEVVVVDDASTDRTNAIVANRSAHDPRVRLLTMNINVGPQKCILTGLCATSGDVVLVLPADLQVIAEDAVACLPMLNETDVLVTWRKHRVDPNTRRVMSWSFNRLVRIMVKLPLHDVDGAFLIRREVIARVAPKVTANSDFLQVELFARAMAEGYRVTEHPIAHYARPGGRPTAVTPRPIAKTFIDLARSFTILRRQLTTTGLKRSDVSNPLDLPTAPTSINVRPSVAEAAQVERAKEP